MTARRAALAVGFACAAFACGGSDGVEPPPPPPPPPAEPGGINFNVVTPENSDDGALLLTVLGGVVDSVTGLAGYEAFHARTSASTRAMVFGSIVDGPLIRVWVPDLSLGARYSVRVDEGAIRGTYDVLPGTSYQVARTP